MNDTMVWSAQQAEALDLVAAWMRDPSQKVFVLHGYAGTGKTHLARHFAEGFNARFAAYTGKAALVLRGKGCNAQTIHSLFYSPIGDNAEVIAALERQIQKARDARKEELRKEIARLKTQSKRPRFSFNPSVDALEADLIVLDESSMVPDWMADDIKRVCKKVLFLGDPAQLPPVKGTSYFMTLKPNALLTEIHRQAADNPILALTARIRQGEMIPRGDFGAVRHISKSESSIAELATYDQLITGMNKTRRRLNVGMRQHLGRAGVYPVLGDRLICLKNNRELGLLNGLQGVAGADAIDNHPQMLTMAIDMEYDYFSEMMVWKDAFDAYVKDVPDRPYYEKRFGEEFEFAYAITVHKSQGSEYRRVAFCDDGFGMGKEIRQSLLYTAATRAKEELLVLS